MTTTSVPPKASAQQIAHLRRASQNGQIVLQDRAERYVNGPWQTTADEVFVAIEQHLATGCGIYCKYETGSARIIPHKIQINLRLDEETGENADVYVELVLSAGGWVYIRNAHPHGNAPRLPR